MNINFTNPVFTLLASACLLGMAQSAGAETVERSGLPDPINQGQGVRITDPIIRNELAALRNATAHFHRFENAAAAGWDLQVSDCVEVPDLGGMGYHYGNVEIFLNGEVNLLEPEVLLYEPMPNGRLRLVGVEYVVPNFAWQGEGFPHIFGHKMEWVGDGDEGVGEGEWQRHVWAWKHNPAGIFSDFNPMVNCDFAND